jgi:hypothetical protein
MGLNGPQKEKRMNRIVFQSAAGIALGSLIALKAVAQDATRLSATRSNAGL